MALSNKHLDQLSEIYSTDKFKVVVFQVHTQKGLSAVAYMDGDETDIIEHCDWVFIMHGLAPFEHITRFYVKRHQKIPTDYLGNVSYNEIRRRAINEYS